MIKLIILGQTPSKKNNQEIRRFRGKVWIAPNKRYDAWERSAVLQLVHQTRVYEIREITEPVHCKFLIYREGKRRADLSNLIQSCEDALEKAGVIKDDFQIVSLDGSRRILGSSDPRTEIYLEVI